MSQKSSKKKGASVHSSRAQEDVIKSVMPRDTFRAIIDEDHAKFVKYRQNMITERINVLRSAIQDKIMREHQIPLDWVSEYNEYIV